MFDCLLMTATGVCDVSLTLTARYELDTQPPVDDHGAVMIHVKKRHLIVLFAQDEKHLQNYASVFVNFLYIATSQDSTNTKYLFIMM